MENVRGHKTCVAFPSTTIAWNTFRPDKRYWFSSCYKQASRHRRIYGSSRSEVA